MSNLSMIFLKKKIQPENIAANVEVTPTNMYTNYRFRDRSFFDEHYPEYIGTYCKGKWGRDKTHTVYFTIALAVVAYIVKGGEQT